MRQPVEIEVKLAASPAMLEQLRALPQLAGDDHTVLLVTTYFDTTCAKLHRGGAALRIRDQAGHREQTLKLALPFGAKIGRQEWNVGVVGEFPELSGFPTKVRNDLSRLLDGAPLEIIATTRIERTTRRLMSGRSVIEIAFDLGKIEAAGREENVCELEMELIEGSLADVLALVLSLPLGPELSWSVRSKADRGHSLAFDLPPKATHTRPVELSPTMDVAQGFQAIAWNCLEQLLANYPLVVASADPESLHQTRVAIRRLRVACSMFSEVVADDAGTVLRAELKAVAAGLGLARDLRIFHDRVAAAAGQSDQDLAELLAHLAGQRDSAARAAQALLGTAPFQRLLVEFAIWLEAGDWLAHLSDTGGDQLLKPFASRVLSRRWHKLRKVRHRLSDLPDTVRHRLRIDAKKLRYAERFFTSLYLDKAFTKDRRSFAQSLTRLQDSLGELNDLAVAATLQDALFSDINPISAARLTAQLDRLLAAQTKLRRKLLTLAEQALADVVATPAWWKAG